MKKYFILEIEVPEYCEDCGGSSGDSVELTTKQLSFDQMLKDPEFRQQLIQAGWADVNAGEGLGDNDLGPRVMLASHYGGNQYVSATIVDLKNTSTLYQMMNSGHHFMAIEVGEEALIRVNPEAAKMFKDVVARRKQAKIAAEASAKKRKETAALKKQQAEKNKIENAKKLLEKAGLKVENP